MSPKQPLKPCPGRGTRYHRCPNLVKSGLCPICQSLEDLARKEYDKQRGTASERGYDGRWAKIRKIKLAEDPLCERCLSEGRTVGAVLVHHKDRNPKNNQWDNLFSCCQPCHELIHKGDRWRR